MYFTDRELAAILNVAKAVAHAGDMIIYRNEQIIHDVFRGLGVEMDKYYDIERKAEKLSKAESCSTISIMPNEKKKFICAFLTVLLMTQFDEPTVNEFTSISRACSLPEVDTTEAMRMIYKR